MKITHIMADGKVLDSIQGVVIPAAGPAGYAYKILAKMARKEEKNDGGTDKRKAYETA